MGAEFLFRLDLPHGRCVGVGVPAEIDPSWLADLLPEERAFLDTVSLARRPTWVAGRLALRSALADLGFQADPILGTKRGGPALPEEVTGSISHKRTLAVALAAWSQQGERIGVDLENAPVPFASVAEARADIRPDIRMRVLTSAEIAALESIPEEHRRRRILLLFSMKEALYKALDPFVHRHVGFHEASIDPRPDGTACITLELHQPDGPFSVEGWWTEIQGHFLTTARVREIP